MRNSRSVLPRLARPLAALAVCTVALSGCSVAGTSFHPGVAATVGDEKVTSSDVDRLTTGVCEAFESQLEQDNQVVPLRYFKTGILQSLALASAARQLGDDYGVTPSSQYRSQVDAVENDSTGLSSDAREALVVARTSEALVQDVLGQVGAKIAAGTTGGTAGAGTDGAAPSAASDQARQVGTDALRTWLQRHEVEVDPQYGIDIGVYPASDGTTSFVRDTDSAVSFGVSSAAKEGAAQTPDQVETKALPASQRCGRYAGS